MSILQPYLLALRGPFGYIFEIWMDTPWGPGDDISQQI
jgi:hypothetical protein